MRLRYRVMAEIAGDRGADLVSTYDREKAVEVAQAVSRALLEVWKRYEVVGIDADAVMLIEEVDHETAAILSTPENTWTHPCFLRMTDRQVAAFPEMLADGGDALELRDYPVARRPRPVGVDAVEPGAEDGPRNWAATARGTGETETVAEIFRREHEAERVPSIFDTVDFAGLELTIAAWLRSSELVVQGVETGRWSAETPGAPNPSKDQEFLLDWAGMLGWWDDLAAEYALDRDVVRAACFGLTYGPDERREDEDVLDYYRRGLESAGYQPARYETTDVEPAEEAPRGLFEKYRVTKADGSPTDPDASYFVLRLDDACDDSAHLLACRAAIKRYAEFAGQFPRLSALVTDLRDRWDDSWPSLKLWLGLTRRLLRGRCYLIHEGSRESHISLYWEDGDESWRLSVLRSEAERLDRHLPGIISRWRQETAFFDPPFIAGEEAVR